jgi:Fe2+ transport system protein FeoA
MRQFSIQEGTTIRVVENSTRKIEVEVHEKILLLSRGQAFRVIVRER